MSGLYENNIQNKEFLWGYIFCGVRKRLSFSFIILVEKF